jgi:Flp pilus assembly protein TadD
MRKVLPVLAAASFAIVVFSAADVLLTRVAAARRAANARWSYSEGERLSKSGHFSEAVNRFRSAVNQEPSNTEYQLALIAALRGAGQIDQAKLSVGGMLEKAPADGAANVEMARILANSGDWRTAAWYYRRALYGKWRSPVDITPLRFELADLLASHHATDDLSAELPLLDQQVANPDQQRHLGKLLLEAQSWKRAEELYDSLLRTAESDGALWAGLGRAQLGAGEYGAAERSLRKASEYSPAADVKRDLELSTKVNQLDPTRRNLDPTERHRRAHEIASAVATALEGCAPGNPDAASAKAGLVHKLHQKATDSTDLDIAEKLWREGQEVCGGRLPVSEAIRRVMGVVLK